MKAWYLSGEEFEPLYLAYKLLWFVMLVRYSSAWIALGYMVLQDKQFCHWGQNKFLFTSSDWTIMRILNECASFI